jgi:hypothetical protein
MQGIEPILQPMLILFQGVIPSLITKNVKMALIDPKIRTFKELVPLAR